MTINFTKINSDLLTSFLDTKPKHKNTFLFTIRDVHVVGISNKELTHEMSKQRKSLVTWMGKRMANNTLKLDGWIITVWARTAPYKYKAVRTHGRRYT